MAQKATALTSKRLAARPKLRLQLDDIQPSTVARYDCMLAQLNSHMFFFGQVTLDTLLIEHETGALQVWVLLLMQLHYDMGTGGLSDIGNLLSGLSRKVRLAVCQVNTTSPISDTFMRAL